MKLTTLTIFKLQIKYVWSIFFDWNSLLQVATSHEYMTRSCFRKRTVPSFPMGSPSKANKTSFACSFKRQGPFREGGPKRRGKCPSIQVNLSDGFLNCCPSLTKRDAYVCSDCRITLCFHISSQLMIRTNRLLASHESILTYIYINAQPPH